VITEEFEDTKGVIIIRKSKDRQHNGQKRKNKSTHNDLQNIAHKNSVFFLITSQTQLTGCHAMILPYPMLLLQTSTNDRGFTGQFAIIVPPPNPHTFSWVVPI
jgi:hypothetical protein